MQNFKTQDFKQTKRAGIEEAPRREEYFLASEQKNPPKEL
jgi:hypothetical protein